MSGIIKPGDPGFTEPGKAAAQIPICMFHKAGRCPDCGMPVFVHTELPGDGVRIYRTCNCETEQGVKLKIQKGYNPVAERESLDYLFKAFELLLLTIETLQEEAHADREDTRENLVGDEPDGHQALPEQGEGPSGGPLEDQEGGRPGDYLDARYDR